MHYEVNGWGNVLDSSFRYLWHSLIHCGQWTVERDDHIEVATCCNGESKSRRQFCRWHAIVEWFLRASLRMRACVWSGALMSWRDYNMTSTSSVSGTCFEIPQMRRVKWRHCSNLWSHCSLYAVRNSAYYVKLSGKDLSRYSSKIESVSRPEALGQRIPPPSGQGTSQQCRDRIRIRIRIATKNLSFVHRPIANLPWKFHANPFEVFAQSR